jgi:uncharacterized protein YeeX (DUF496 family)
MNKHDIKEIIGKLMSEYELAIEDEHWSTAVDIHDEISRWMRELKEFKV